MRDAPPRVRILSLAVHERRWALRIPFHYGVTELRHATEIHLACDIEIDRHLHATGFAAEIAAPKWFEKSPSLSPNETVNRLRGAVAFVVAHVQARALPPQSIAGLTAALKDELSAETPQINALELSFAIALVERAAIDALCRAGRISFHEALRSDALGLADLWLCRGGFRLDAWLADLVPARLLAVRHTVGLADALTASELTEDIGGRPVALEDVIALDGVHQFKIKLGRSPEAVARLETVARLLDRCCAQYSVTLDANEAFTDPEEFAGLCEQISRSSRFTRFWEAVRYIEQPFDRQVALSTSVGDLRIGKPIIIDESDCDASSFELALALGYHGVSIKTCKGAIRGILNTARCAALKTDGEAGTGIFVTAEDLCVQPGIGLQQNIALAAALGLANAERNGHHFGPGPSALPPAERSALTTWHSDLYTSTRLVVRDGCLSAVSTLDAAGFGTTVVPDFAHDSVGLELIQS